MNERSRYALLAVLVLTLVGPGCSRKFFRKAADKDVEGIISQKNQFPDWEVKNWFAYPHPDARFADPFNPDRPPYPPDDPAARALSPNPQHPTKRTGVGRVDGEGYLHLLEQWDAENRARDGAAGNVGAVPEPSGVVPASAQVKVDLPAIPVVQGSPVPLPKKDGLPNVPPAPSAGQPDPPQGFPSTQTLIALGGSPDDFLRALYTNQIGYRIRVDQAVSLGLINSREFQDRREDLYLAALPVTLERYNFAAQAFFAEQVVRDFVGSELGGGRLWSLNTTTGVNKNFSTGASLLVRLANQVVIDLGSNRPDIAFSNLTLSFAQPFLRGGGFAVNLEALTQSERSLLYGMRSYARFRKLFYVATVAGPAGGLGLTNNPYGLQGLSVNLGRGIGGNLTSPVIGYYPLLQQSAVIANQRKNVAFLSQLLRLYEAFREGGQQSDLQVGQVEVQLLNSRGQLLGSPNPGGGGGGGSGIRGFLDALDNYKLQLGLPVTVGLDLDDAPLRPIREQLTRFENIYSDLAKFETTARQYNLNDPIGEFRPRWRRLLTESDLVRGTTFSRTIGARWDAWAGLTDDAFAARSADIRKQRTALLDERAKRQLEGKPEPPAEIRRLAALDAELDLAAFERAVRVYVARPWLKLDGPARAANQAGAFRDVFYAFYQVALEARNERLADVRTKWPDLPPLMVNGVNLLDTDLDDAYTVGVQTALSGRLDLMNARGQVVDAFRQIAVQANALQGTFNVQYDHSAATPAGGSQPFNFSGSRSRQTLTFTGELPLVRRAERNDYRAALIGYQRQRRTLMAFEDNIATDVRNDIRELRTQAQLYRIQQRVVDLGYSQVDNAKELLVAPPAPGAASDAGSAAALTQQVLQAQSSLLTAQNALYTLWVNYLTARMNLYLDLELMQLDERGVWINEQSTEPDRGPAGEQPRERLPAPRPAGPADRK